MGVPAIVVAEVAKCGGQLMTKVIGDVVQFNMEKVRLKQTGIKTMGEMIYVYEDYNKVYIESSERAYEKIIKVIPNDADPNQIVELLMQYQKGHNTLLRTAMWCGAAVTSVVSISVAMVLSAAMGKPVTVTNQRGIIINTKDKK